MTIKRKYTLTASALFLSASLLLTGCNSSSKTPQTGEIISLGSDTGKIVLSVNPEITVSYDKDGQVTALDGVNDDGEKIVSAYGEADGKSCETVTADLVREIYEAGYFDDDVDGNDKNIVVQLVRGSAVPRESFLSDIKASVMNTTKSFSLNASVIDISDDDYDESYTTAERPSPYITKEKAMQIAALQAGVPFDQALFTDREFDFDDGAPIYELEFYYQDTEYDYEIDAVNGTVLSHRHKKINSGSIPSSNTSYIGAEQAKSTALSHAGISASAAVFTKAEFDFDDGTPVYELEFYANGIEYEYEIHAGTGAVIKFERDRDNSGTNTSKPTAGTSYISTEKAKSAALSHAGISASAAVFTKTKLDSNDGVIHYEIEFYANGVEYEYEIHATTGAVIDFDRDRDDDHDRDDDYDYDDHDRDDHDND